MGYGKGCLSPYLGGVGADPVGPTFIMKLEHLQFGRVVSGFSVAFSSLRAETADSSNKKNYTKFLVQYCELCRLLFTRITQSWAELIHNPNL